MSFLLDVHAGLMEAKDDWMGDLTPSSSWMGDFFRGHERLNEIASRFGLQGKVRYLRTREFEAHGGRRGR